jgi:hypothetical protein
MEGADLPIGLSSMLSGIPLCHSDESSVDGVKGGKQLIRDRDESTCRVPPRHVKTSFPRYHTHFPTYHSTLPHSRLKVVQKSPRAVLEYSE